MTSAKKEPGKPEKIVRFSVAYRCKKWYTVRRLLRKYKIKKVAIITAIILLIVALLICFYCYLVYYATEPIYIYEAPVKEILDN